jgi:hypothetical protein
LRPAPPLLFPVADRLLFLTARPPVNRAVDSQTSNGIIGGWTEIPIPFGTDTRNLAIPTPVTDDKNLISLGHSDPSVHVIVVVFVSVR